MIGLTHKLIVLDTQSSGWDQYRNASRLIGNKCYGYYHYGECTAQSIFIIYYLFLSKLKLACQAEFDFVFYSLRFNCCRW